MATLDFSRSKHSFSMTEPQFVGFETAVTTQPGLWQFKTPGGHTVTLRGSGLTYDSSGRATAGTVTSVSFDLDSNDPAQPDATVTGLSAPAALFDDGPASFWRFLEGNDVIYGPSTAQGAANAGMIVVGDGVAARPGSTVGGSDVIQAGDGYVIGMGDVQDVGSSVAGSPAANYRGGNDQVLGLETSRPQILSGDASAVWAGSKLTGGHDTILAQSTYAYGSTVAGDAQRVTGAAGVTTEVIGGDDAITAGINFRGTLAGDVHDQRAGSLVRGGADAIKGGEQGEIIVGDVYRLASARLIGGNDTIDGNGGNDTIYGDSYIADGYSTITGGKDVIRGGRGADTIFGDYGNGGNGNVGGDDQLYGGDGDDWLDGDAGHDVLNGDAGRDTLVGDEGDDRLYAGMENDVLSGGSGNDLMDGGAGADTLSGASGDDTYFVNDVGDRVIEGAGAGTDTVWSFLSNYALGANIETLRFNGQGDFRGIGNGLDNVMAGSAGSDYLYGADGDDVLIGGAGADRLLGMAGTDTASYASATTGGVNAHLDLGGIGGDAAYDFYVDIENLTGSDFGDGLYGNSGANTLSGGAGEDYLDAGLGNDTLTGGGGRDILNGGEGNDTFVFNALGEGRDTIYGFSNVAGNDDRLQLEGDAFGGLAAGALPASRFVANTSGVATTTSQRFVYETDTGILRFDANGSAAGGVTEVALLEGAPILTASDFLIV